MTRHVSPRGAQARHPARATLPRPQCRATTRGPGSSDTTGPTGRTTHRTAPAVHRSPPEPSIDPLPATAAAADAAPAPAAKPLLYLDIDGVLNPVCPRPAAEFTAHRIHGSTVLMSVRHGSWLRELSAVYQLVWASTWEAQANLCIAPLLDLPALPFVPVGRRAGQPAGDWAPILRHAAGRPFAWVDDLIPDAVLLGSAARADRLLLPVDPGQGLRRSHVDRLLRRPPVLLSSPRRG
ncbi:HAD domain-containing protein [Streptacidiphilus sp. PAMC 29251]